MKEKNDTLKYALTILMGIALAIMLYHNIFSGGVLMIGAAIGILIIWVGFEGVADQLKNPGKK